MYLGQYAKDIICGKVKKDDLWSHLEVTTVEVEISPPKQESWEDVRNQMIKYGFEVVRIDFIDALGVKGISGVLITIDSYNKSNFVIQAKKDHWYYDKYFLYLDKGIQIINPHYSNYLMMSSLRNKTL